MTKGIGPRPIAKALTKHTVAMLLVVVHPALSAKPSTTREARIPVMEVMSSLRCPYRSIVKMGGIVISKLITATPSETYAPALGSAAERISVE